MSKDDQYPARTPWPAITLGLFLLCASEAVLAEQPAERRGLRFVGLHCARCHSIEQNSESPLASASPFRALHLKYAVADQQRPLAEEIHPSMPLFRLTPGHGLSQDAPLNSPFSAGCRAAIFFSSG
jgi:mono/diheme cytochrome c family protein